MAPNFEECQESFSKRSDRGWLARKAVMILFKSIGIRLYLSSFDWFGTKHNSVWFQINQKMVNKIWCRLILKKSEKEFSAWKKVSLTSNRSHRGQLIVSRNPLKPIRLRSVYTSEDRLLTLLSFYCNNSKDRIYWIDSIWTEAISIYIYIENDSICTKELSICIYLYT